MTSYSLISSNDRANSLMSERLPLVPNAFTLCSGPFLRARNVLSHCLLREPRTVSQNWSGEWPSPTNCSTFGVFGQQERVSSRGFPR